MTNRLLALLLACPIILISSYSLAEKTDETFKGHVPHMKIEKVIQAANKYVNEKEIKIDNYFVQNASYDSSKGKWLLLYNGTIPIPGNHFMISINDITGEILLIPGR